MMYDALGDRMKSYEKPITNDRLNAFSPIYVRIDGRNFSKFTRGMPKPFSSTMSHAMVYTAKHLVEQTHARIGYVQSDEINLVYAPLSREDPAAAANDFLFGAKKHKLHSVLASMATAKFNFMISKCPPYNERLPHFDARAVAVPMHDIVNMLRWRFMDCTRNAISATAHHHFGHSALQGVSTRDMLSMLKEADIDYTGYPAAFRFGTFVHKEKVVRDLTPTELAAIPEHHRPTGPVTRNQMIAYSLPEFMHLKNTLEVIFDHEEPRYDL